MDERNLGCNRSYIDLRRLTWSEARHAYIAEGDFIRRIEESSDPTMEYDQIEDERLIDFDELFGLDIGIASSVVALSAARCVPFSSCNAGAYGGSHHEDHPVVAFFARSATANLLLECAQESKTGLENSHQGSLIAYANDIRRMREFADAIIARRREFRSLRFKSDKSGTRPKRADPNVTQFDLF